jgi:hypothetical protein
MKDAKGHGSNPRGGIAHQSGIMTALTKDRLTGLVPPGSARDHAVKTAAKWAAAELIPGGSLWMTYRGAKWAVNKLRGSAA